MKITIIVGLPGSGKTTFAKTLVKENVVLFDDPGALQKTFDEMMLYINQNKGDAIVTDIYCFNETTRKGVEEYLYSNGVSKIDWIFFENDPESCIKNIKTRNEISGFEKYVSENRIKLMSREYTIPESSIVIPVYK